MKDNVNLKKKKTLALVIVILVISIFFLIFLFKMAKNNKFGNNNISQEESLKKILNMTSYEAKIEVQVKSNKNTNTYKIYQEYEKDKKSIQEVLEPENIKGVRIEKTEEKLKLENTKLNLTTFFDRYDKININDLDLNSFILQYLEDEEKQTEEFREEIVLKTKNKMLYLNKKTKLPTKMEIKEDNKNTKVYILYNEITIK